MKPFLLFVGLLAFTQTARSQALYTWTGAVSSSWSTPGNWTPSGVPGATDNATIVTGSNACVLNADAGLANLTVSSGTLDLGGYTLTVSGTTVRFLAGTVQNGTLTVSGAGTTTFGNGPMTMNCTVNVTSASVTLKNTTFQGPLSITKTGSSNDASSGGNTFNGSVTITNSGSGSLTLGNGNPDQFNSTATFNNSGSNNINVANSSTGNVFAGTTTFNNSPSTNNGIYVSWNSAGTVFNGNIIVTSTGGTGVQFCGGNSSATATLAAGETLGVGPAGFSAGTLLLRQFTQAGSTPQSLTLTGTASLNFGPSATFNGNLTTSSPALILSGCTFNGTTNLTKNGTTGDWGQGGNTFNGVCSITNSGSSYLVMGNTNPDTWNNDVTFTDNGSDRLLPCWGSAGNQFNGNIYVNSSGSATGIEFCGGNAAATATLAATYTIQPGSDGLTAGYLYLRHFTQAGSAPVTITATGTSTLYLGPSSTFGGVFSATAPDIYAQGATYNSAATFTKTGGNSDNNNQYQNIFNSTCTINQQSNTGYFMLGYNSNDQFNGDITVTSTGTGGIYLGAPGGSGAQSPTLSAGNTITVGGAGFSAGFLSLNTFTQQGNAPINLTFTGTSTSLTFAHGSVIGGDVTTSTPDVFFSGCTFGGTVNATKTGSNSDAGSGGNIFQDTTTITNAGAGNLYLGNGTADTWNNNLSLVSTGSAYIGLAWNSAGNTINGNLSVASTGSSTGIEFCGNAASNVTLSAGYTVQVGSAGFSTGTLLLKRFTQAGNAPINLALTGASTTIQVGPSSSIGGNFTVVSPNILLDGASYADSVNVTKTGANGQWSSGGNTFNSTLTVNQQGSGYFGFANGTPDIYNGDVYTNNNSTERIIFGNNSTGNQFNGNIIMTQTGSSVGTAFGWSASTSEIQAAGKTLSIGAAGFSAGYLQIERFTQLGSAPVNLPLSGTASLTYGPSSSFGGPVTSSSPTLLFNGCVFSGNVNATKTGSSNDQSQGNNTFNDSATFTDNGTGYLMMTTNSPDAYNGNTSFVQTGSGAVYPNYNGNSAYAGNVSVTSPSATAITFGKNGGTATFSGSAPQAINATAGAATPVFTNLAIANTGGGVTLTSTSVNVSKSLTLTSGLLNTSSTYILTMLNGSTTSAGTALSTSYVNGPMRYQKSSAGTTTLNFPIGAAPDCRPVILTVDHTNGALYTYTAQLYNASAAALGYTLPPTVDGVSEVHYYTITRTDVNNNVQPTLGLTGNQVIQIFFGQDDDVTNGSTLTIVKNTYLAPASWIDIGGTGAPPAAGGVDLTGSVTSTSSPTAFNSFSTFALADLTGGGNTLPIDFLDFTATPDDTQVGLAWTISPGSNTGYFTVERSRDGIDFEPLENVYTAGKALDNGGSANYTAYDAKPYAGVNYYRVKQTRPDSTTTYSDVVPVNFTGSRPVSVYPNPATGGSVYVSGLGPDQDNLTVSWFDSEGRTVLRQTVAAQGGLAALRTPVGNGVYFLKFITPDGLVRVQKIIVLR